MKTAGTNNTQKKQKH